MGEVGTTSDPNNITTTATQKMDSSSSADLPNGGFKVIHDPHFTDSVIAAMGPKTSPRMREVMTSLLHHLHDFAREVNLTVPEWMAAVDMINESGRMSDATRNETQLLSDILGLESLVDETTSQLLASSLNNGNGTGTDTDTSTSKPSAHPTASAILGPFWRANAPILPMDTSIVTSLPASIPESSIDHTYLHGRVLSSRTGLPIAGAELDIWHTAPNGLYEQQDTEQPDMNLRGRFVTGKEGRYGIYCLRPTSYPIPDDGPAGRLLGLLDRHPMRPAHIHFILTAPGYNPLTTQIFDRRDKHVLDDAVFAVKKSLIVDFVPRKDDPKAQFELEYDFHLTEA